MHSPALASDNAYGSGEYQLYLWRTTSLLTSEEGLLIYMTLDIGMRRAGLRHE